MDEIDKFRCTILDEPVRGGGEGATGATNEDVEITFRARFTFGDEAYEVGGVAR